MAGTVQINVSITATNGEFTHQFSKSASITQTTQGVYDRTHSLTTSETTISSGLTANGYCTIVNLDATNKVLAGPDSTGLIDLLEIPIAMFAVLPLKAAATLKIKAAAGTPKARVIIHEQ